ncbi:hypothetical protein DC083_04135 [Ignatzschineria ureiclastica]|uniref:Uncharacterized protein n=1 Tax=Ignatzschineria ureiclastica TaxID=472582 RepID=A0A2U2AEP8_9GAMM|nr:hypothetical protein [Ignatzschineria ureiclastica]PWD81097.1 hypothetical protein DC083_04135 [Ignatzschineria ureiclastica]GGZ96212.1 hypothetical protein GCM10007162_10350 [Ignatzschineria ureiclastica]
MPNNKSYLLIIGSALITLSLFSPINAETSNEIYGTLSYGLQKQKSNQPNLHYTPHDQSSLPSHPHYQPKEKSRLTPDNKIGIKGEKPIGNGNSIIYQFEWGDEK